MPCLNQPSIFDLPYQSGSDSSHAAAIAARDFVGPQGAEVLEWLKTRPAKYGGTQVEAHHALNISRASLCARFRALELRGDIQKNGLRREACAAYGVTGI